MQRMVQISKVSLFSWLYRAAIVCMKPLGDGSPRGLYLFRLEVFPNNIT